MKRLLIVMATLLGITVAPSFSATSAFAAVTTYHSYCNGVNCSDAQRGKLFLSVQNVSTDTKVQYQIDVYGVRNGGSWQMIPTKLAYSVAGEVHSLPVSAKCYYLFGQHANIVDHTCSFVVPGNVKRTDLYGHYAFQVFAHAAATSIKKGDSVAISARVTPNAAKQRIYLQRFSNGAWQSLKSAILSGSSRSSFTVRPSAKGDWLYRVYKPSHGNYGHWHSRSVSITVS